MPEIIAKKAWRNASKDASRFFEYLEIFPAGVWVVIMVFLLVGGRWAWVHENRPKHFDEITKAYGTVSLFYGAAQINHSGNQFTYVAKSDLSLSPFSNH